MSKGATRVAIAALCLFVPLSATAAELIPVEDFARHEALSEPRLSPDGQYLAVTMSDGDEHSLVVYAISDMSKPVSMLRMPKFEIPVDVNWVSPTRMVMEVGKEYGSIDKPFLTGEIIATNVDGKHQDYLFGYKGGGTRSGTRNPDEGWGYVVGVPYQANNEFYMRTNAWGDSQESAHSSLYSVDAAKNLRHLIGDINVGEMDFLVDNGQARYAYGNNSDFKYVVYLKQENGWTQLGRQQLGVAFEPIVFTPDHQSVFAYYSQDGGPRALVEQSPIGENRKIVAAGDFGSIGSVQWTPYPYQPFAVSSATGVPAPIYVDPNLPSAKLHFALSQKFPGSFVRFINYSEDGSQLLFGVSSDRDPGSYYLIDTKHYKVHKLFAEAPWVDSSKMGERRPFRFKASDGTEIEAILTIPSGAPLHNLPMVLLPHGGPHGISDDWFFDWESQFLASRGYLVLQVNYRGSGGRGHNFETAGFMQWGTRIQQDLIDGVKWAEEQGYADPQRVCVYGASFGGYSAMMSTIRAPGLFKCAIGYAGVYDLSMMYEKGDTHEVALGRSFLHSVIGTDPTELNSNSPDKLADKINIPVLLIHGEDDQRAPFAQAQAMRAALDAAHKPYEWMSKPEEGHGFYSEQNNIERLTQIQTFLAKYIGTGASTAPGSSLGEN